MPKKKILIPMMEAGAGHKMPALAVKDAIEELFPGKYEIHVSDFAKECGAVKFDQSMKDFWDYSLAHTFFSRISYLLGEILHPTTRLFIPIFHRKYIRLAGDYIKEFQPDIIFSTHFFSTQVCRIVRDKYKLPFKVIGYVTEPFEAYSFWCDRKVDCNLVASDRARKRMRHHWVPRSKLKIIPFPINNKFSRTTHTREEVLSELGLDLSRKTLIATGGGQGIGKIVTYIKSIYKSGVPVNLIVACGKNEKLKNELEQLIKDIPSDTKMIPLGFVTNMNELLKAADFCLAKAGPSTTFEALIMECPIIFSNWANFAEKPNVDYCKWHHVGWLPRNEKQLSKIINSILNENILDEYKENIRIMNFRSGASDVAKYIVNQMETNN